LIDKLALAKKERIKRLQVLAEKAKASFEDDREAKAETAGRKEFNEKFSEIEALFARETQDSTVRKYHDDFLSDFNNARNKSGVSYIAVIQGLPAHVSTKGTLWLQSIVDNFCEKTKSIVPSLSIFGK